MLNEQIMIDGEFYKNLLDNVHDGIYYVDRDRKIKYWNKVAEELTGYKSSEVLGNYCFDNLLMDIDSEGVDLCKERCPLVEAISDGHPREVELYFHHKDGHRVPVIVRVAPMRDSRGEITGAVEVFTDNSARVAILQRLQDCEKMALLDPLTNLPNRRYIEMNLDSRLDEMHRYGWTFGVLFIDIDHFKKINDRYGHEVGDEVLNMIGKTLLTNLRPFDILGRWGGEELIAIIVNVDEQQLYSTANRFRLLVEHSGLHRGSDIVRATISIGATLSQASDTIDTLLKRADQLMYRSKTSGRNRVSMKLDE